MDVCPGANILGIRESLVSTYPASFFCSWVGPQMFSLLCWWAWPKCMLRILMTELQSNAPFARLSWSGEKREQTTLNPFDVPVLSRNQVYTR